MMRHKEAAQYDFEAAVSVREQWDSRICKKQKTVKSPPSYTGFPPKQDAYAIFVSLKHLSHSHIMPRTLPVAVIIFAACMGLPQH
jgi:hypothetical protein